MTKATDGNAQSTEKNKGTKNETWRRSLPGFYEGERCPHCRKGKLEKREGEPRLGCTNPECGESTRPAGRGDYYGSDP